MVIKKLTWEKECQLLLRHYFSHVPVKELAAECGISVNEAKKLIAEDCAVRRREQQRIEETGGSVLLSPISIYLYSHFAKVCPQHFKMEKVG